MAISKEQIFAVADELDAAGQNPTLANVRKQLGSGSFTTISEAMNEWRTQPARPPRSASRHRRRSPTSWPSWAATSGPWRWKWRTTAWPPSARRWEAVRRRRKQRAGSRRLADQLTGELDEAKAAFWP